MNSLQPGRALLTGRMVWSSVNPVPADNAARTGQDGMQRKAEAWNQLNEAGRKASKS
jgi:hypothetical protein